MGVVTSQQDYLVYTCETERFEKPLYFPRFSNKFRSVRVMLLGLIGLATLWVAAKLHSPTIWLIYACIILAILIANFYFARLRASWLHEGIIYEATTKRVRSMTHSGRWLGYCDYENKSIKVVPLANGFSEVHIRSKRIENHKCNNLFVPADMGEQPPLFIMYQLSNADYYVSLMNTNT